MKSAFTKILFSLSLLTASCGGSPDLESPETLQFPEIETGMEQAQILTAPDGGLHLVWTTRGNDGIDLFMSSSEGRSFSGPVRVNDVPGSINPITIDEMRPSVAIGAGGDVAVAWTDDAFDIQVAQSGDGGQTFGESIQLNQDEGEALQEFPAIAFDASGILHGVWLDPRIAEEGLEEPADLYYARIEDSAITEMNLTAFQDSTVCGCCLPHLRVEPEGAMTITFRNTTDDGYRDPFRIVGNVDGRFGAPERVSPPIWQIELCPIAGPIGVEDMTLWLDGSLDYRRLLSSFDPDTPPDVVLEDSPDWLLLAPPRLVSGLSEGRQVVLVPGDPTSFLMTVNEHSWSVLEDDMPYWAASATIHDGQLLTVGVVDGTLQHESRTFRIDD